MAADTVHRQRFPSLYAASWEVRLEEVAGADPSRLCLMLSGQGAAFPGMFRAQLEDDAAFQQVLAEVDAVAAEHRLPPPSDYLRGQETGAVEDLVIVRNLALCAAEVGLFRAIPWSLPRPFAVTGFSIGEYAALAVAGVLSVRDMATILVARDRACPPPYATGRMVAVAAAPGLVAPLLPAAGYFVSNLCSPTQTTISVAPDAVEDTLRRLAAGGVRATVLDDVPQPYHTPWLARASELLRAQLHEMDFALHPAQLPVISSVTGAVVDGQPSRAQMVDLLARQLVAPVDWVAQVSSAWRAGCGAYLELGPGRALARFTQATLGEKRHQLVALDAVLPKRRLAPAHEVGVEAGNPLFKLMQRVIARLTGFELDSIHLTDRFQEDLGIDSIKKAEILITVVDEAGVTLGGDYNAARFAQLADAVIALQASAGEPVRQRTANFQRLVEWLEEAPLAAPEELPVAPALVVDLERLVADDPGFATLSAAPEETVVVRADSAACSGHGDVAADLDLVDAACRGFRAWARREAERERVVVLVTARDTRPVVRGLAGLLRCLVRELPLLVGKHLDFDRRPDEPELLRRVDGELRRGRSFAVRFRAGGRHETRLVPLPTVPTPLPWTGRGVVVAFGGAGGIGLSLLEGLAAATPLKLWLAGTRPAAEVAAAVRALRAAGVTVDYRQVDARSGAAVAALLRDAVAADGRVDLVLNLVGREHSAKLADQSDQQIRSTLETKILAAWEIARAADAVAAPLCVHASSIAARWGNTGQGPYATANQAVVELCTTLARQPGRCRQVAVNWPPWDNVGMTAQPGLSARLRQLGFALLDAKRASELFREELGQPSEAVVDFACPEDQLVLSTALADDRRWRPLLGRRSPEGSFIRRLGAASDPWLADHSIAGSALVPAAFSLATTVAVADLAGMGSCSIRDHEILNALPVGADGATLETRLVATGAGLELAGRAHLAHYRCRVEPGVAVREASAPPSGTARVDVPYNDAGLFHGPRFQMLERVAVAADGGLVAEIDPARLAQLTGCRAADQLILIFDAAFQLLALVALRARGVMVIPQLVEQVDVDLARLVAAGGLTLTAHEAAADGHVGDVVVTGPEHDCLLTLRGVKLLALSSEPAATPPTKVAG